MAGNYHMLNRSMECHIVLLVLLMLLCGSRCHPCDIRTSQEHGGILADCSGMGLTSVPNDLPYDIAALDLSLNNMTMLRNFTFRSFTNMTFMSLFENSLERMESMTFYGFYTLQVLNLNNNRLRSDHYSFPVGVFNNLVNLHTLWIEGQYFDVYPDWIFTPLVNLKTLFIDSIQMPKFGKGFSYLKKLEYLQMDSHGYDKTSRCDLFMLKNNTFEGLRNISLKTLNVSHCKRVFSVETGVFEPLGFLDTLIFSKIDIGIHKSLQLLNPFVGRHFKTIDLSSIYPRSRYSIPSALDSFLNETDTEFLSKICVKEFIYNNNHIVNIASSALFGKPFSECLERLDLSKNALIGDIRLFFTLQNFINMKILLFGEMSLKQVSTGHLFDNAYKTISLPLPETLEVFDISGLLNHESQLDLGGISVLELRNTTKLKTFISSNNYLPENLKFKGIENVEELDLSNNDIDDISQIGFHPFTKVKTLSLKGCNLRLGKSKQNNLTNFPNVQAIDISNNLLSKVPILANPWNVMQLILKENSFESIPIDLELFPILKKMDLTFNAISFLSKIERDKVDSAHAISDFKLYLRGNTFSCGCKGLDFVQWLVETPAIYETDRSFTCILDNGTTTDTMKVASNIHFHTRHCRGSSIFTLTITLGLLLMIAITGTYVIMKNPTRYQNAILKTLGIVGRISTPDEFNFILYVAYTSADIPLVYRKLRTALEKQNIPLFLKDREVIPGHDIADGISEGINSSWKTLLVVSRDFLNDSWSTFTINSALYSMTEMIPNRIIILLVDGVQLGDLPETLLTAVDEDFVLDYDTANVHYLWDELIHLLK